MENEEYIIQRNNLTRQGKLYLIIHDPMYVDMSSTPAN